MTYPFKFNDVAEPQLAYGAARQWGGMTARMLRASAGRHAGGPLPDHRVIFYNAGPTHTECGCDGLIQRRLQTPGDFDIVPAGFEGFWEDSTPTDMVSIRLSPDLMARTAEDLEAPGGRVQLSPRLGARDPLVDYVARALMAELAAPAPVGRLYADSLAVALASRLIQGFAMTRWRSRQTLSKPQLRRVIDYIEANLEAELSLAELAGVTGVSVPHLTTLFRRTMGQSVHRYVVERRVQQARTLLLGGERSVAQVALSTGFAHQSHLARWMKRMLGVTPSEILREA